MFLGVLLFAYKLQHDSVPTRFSLAVPSTLAVVNSMRTFFTANAHQKAIRVLRMSEDSRWQHGYRKEGAYCLYLGKFGVPCVQKPHVTVVVAELFSCCPGLGPQLRCSDSLFGPRKRAEHRKIPRSGIPQALSPLGAE